MGLSGNYIDSGRGPRRGCDNCGGDHDGSVCPLAASQPPSGDAPDPILAGLQRNDMGRVLALALSSQGYAQTDSEAVGLALLREIEDCGYTLRLTTHEERREKNDRGMSS